MEQPIRTESPWSWQREMAECLRTAEDLVAAGLIPAEQREAMRAVLGRYRLALPRYYAGLIDRADPRCPIRLQALPSLEELQVGDGYHADPLRDADHRPAPRVTHRYPGRALLHLTPNCSMYCRYCFRKTLLNDLRETLFDGEITQALDYFAQHREIEEVIFSGGDPLLASEAQLDAVLQRLDGIAHIERIRFHTRVPVTLPSRVTAEWAGRLKRLTKPVVLVAHFNHPRELTFQSESAIGRLQGAGVLVLNQSVLLRGVNDSPDVLADLSHGLFRLGVLPYYLHHPDPASGTAHFGVTEARGLEIHSALRARLSGYLVPRYVRDEPGVPYKRNVSEIARPPGI
jgi:lysine 2,3-aminomutase